MSLTILTGGLSILSLLLSNVNGHSDWEKLGLGDVRVEDMWCFDPAYRVGVPNLYKKVRQCLEDPVAYERECDSAYNNFCAVNGIDKVQCNMVWDMADPTKNMNFNCKSTLLLSLSHLETRLSECTATEAYQIWESHLVQKQGPHHALNEDMMNTAVRRLLNYRNHDSLTYHVGDSHTVARQHNVANFVHEAIDMLTLSDEQCLKVYDVFRYADNVALLGNLRIGSLNAADVHGKKFEELYRTFEGDAVVNHGDIEMHFSPQAFWDLFNGLAISGVSNHIHCNTIYDIDQQWRSSCHRDPYTKHY